MASIAMLFGCGLNGQCNPSPAGMPADAIPWTILEVFELTEEATTSSGRIFLKVLLQDLSERLGLRELNDRLQNPELASSVKVKGSLSSGRNFVLLQLPVELLCRKKHMEKELCGCRFVCNGIWGL